MDLIKIGKYIAGKRKALGMTQKQLAEKLGMSDKSVSKWERGVCLPDVSVYKELCSILGISFNEFLAGEDIAQEKVEYDFLSQVCQTP
jgi:transcriptional regulator with XRE-family HTH domain